MMEIKTKRLILREYVPSDIKEIASKINDIEVSKYLAVVSHPYELKDAEWFVSNCLKNAKKQPREKYELAVTSKKDGEFIGGTGLFGVDRYVGSAELGYWLGKKYWRQGFMSEAVTALINFAFEELKLNRIILPAYVPNVGSNGLAKKLGFTLEGTTRESARTKSTGKVYDTNHWGLLKREWENKMSVVKG